MILLARVGLDLDCTIIQNAIPLEGLDMFGFNSTILFREVKLVPNKHHWNVFSYLFFYHSVPNINSLERL